MEAQAQAESQAHHPQRVIPIVARPEPADGAQRPAQARKGRGAVSNLIGRFETLRSVAEDDGWYREDGEPPPLHTEVREERARSLITRNTSPDVGFDRSINPYRGCEHGCVYCYARPNHAYVGLSPGLDFESRLFAKVNAPQLLARELCSPKYVPAPMAVGVVTDAYQPIERQLRLTRGCLEVLERSRHPAQLITKSSLIERDLDLLQPMAARAQVLVNVSLTTLDHGLARKMEPRCASPTRRLETIRRLSQAGVPVGVSVSPVIPFINEPEIEHILAAAYEAGARWAFHVVIRLPWEVEHLFRQWLETHFPQRTERVWARIAEMRAGAGEGKINDARFGSRMTGEGVWADLIHQRFAKACERLGYASEYPALSVDGFVPPRPASAQGELF